MTPLRDVAVLIVSWNGKKHLEKCLRALEQQQDPGMPWKCVVLDNASVDGTSEWIREAHPQVEVVRSEENLGFCSGNNLLAEHCTADGIALLNNDTRPRPGWLKNLVDSFQRAPSDVYAVSGKIVDWEGHRLDFASGIMTFDAHAFQLGAGVPLERARLPADGDELFFACGGNMLMERQRFLELGGFDDDQFAYLEDVDLGWRIWASGGRVVFSDQAVVHHRSMATSQLLGDNNRGFLFERNALANAYKNFDDEMWPRMLPAVLLTFMARTDTLLRTNNPGGGLVAVDPYRGHIAATGSPGRVVAGPRRGVAELARAALGRIRRRIGGVPRSIPVLTDERTLANLRAQHSVLSDLAPLAEKRRRTQAQRKRTDREIFEKFPLWVVPTYPGDRELLTQDFVDNLLPSELSFRLAALEEVMSFDD